MSCNQQPNITGAMSNSRTPLSATAGYSIQESRRKMLETIDRRRSEMLNASNAAAAAAALARGSHIGMVGSAAAMPRLPATSSLIRNYDQQSLPSSSSADQQRLAAGSNNRRNGFVSSFPTPNGGSFMHMKFPPSRGGAPVQHQQHQQQAQQLLQQAASASRGHVSGSLAAVPAGALRAYGAAASTSMQAASNMVNSGQLLGAAARYAPPNAIVQAAADSSTTGLQAQQSGRARNQQHHQQHQQRSRSSALNVPTQATQMPPTFPEVAIQPHPFSDHLAPVMHPTAILPMRLGQRLQTAELTFTLSQEQAETIALTRYRHPLTQRTEYGVQVQLRCFKIGPGPQSDCFPPGISLAVNKNQVTTLPPPMPTNKPSADPMRPGRPVNISGHCRISHAVLNRLTLTWLHDPAALGYCVTVGLVRAVTPDQLTERLLAQQPISSGDTRARIAELLGGSASPDDVSLTDLRAALRCPLSRGRIRIPARGVACSHLQCFDAPTYLTMNERKPAWRCPCCDRQLPLAELRVDEFFREVLAAVAAAPPVETVRFLPDGSWIPVDESACDGAASAVSGTASATTVGAVVDLTDDAPPTAPPSACTNATTVPKPPPPPPPQPSAKMATPGAPAAAPAKRPAAAASDTCGPDGILVITLDSSDDEDSETAPPARPPAPQPPPAKRPHLPPARQSQGNPGTGGSPANQPSRSVNGGNSPTDYRNAGWGFPGNSSMGNPGNSGLVNPVNPGNSGMGNPGNSGLGNPGNPGNSGLGNPGNPGNSVRGGGDPLRSAGGSPASAVTAAQPPPMSQQHRPRPDFTSDGIPLPPAFIQDQQRLSALLATTASRPHQQQQPPPHSFESLRY